MIAPSVTTDPPSLTVSVPGGGTKSRRSGNTNGCVDVQNGVAGGIQPPSGREPRPQVRKPCIFIRSTASTRPSVAKTGGSQATGVSTDDPRMAVGPAYSVTKALPLATGLSTARLTSSL